MLLRLLLSLFVSIFVAMSAFAQAPGLARVMALLDAGQFAEADAALEALNPSDMDRRFFTGLALKRQGAFGDAVAVFRFILAAEPGNVAARRELAHALFLNREYRAARFHFEALEQADPDLAMRPLHRNFLNLIAQNQPYGLTGFFAIIPSTNVTRGSSRSVFDTSLGTLDITSREQSGYGLNVGFSGYFRRVLSDVRKVEATWSLNGTRYENRDLDSATGTVALNVEALEPWGRWSAGPYVRQTVRVDDGDNTAIGFSLSGRYRASARDVIFASASHEVREYAHSSTQDGPFTSVSIGLERQMSPAWGLSGGIGFERSAPEEAYLAYDGIRLFGGAGRMWTGGLQTNANIEFGVRDFKANFPLTTTRRADEYVRFGLGVTHARFTYGGFAPRLNCTHTINGSNIALYEYDATDCQMALTRAF